MRIPPGALYSDKLARGYLGIGLAVITLYDGFVSPSQARSAPGSFVAIDGNANKKILSPAGNKKLLANLYNIFDVL